MVSSPLRVKPLWQDIFAVALYVVTPVVVRLTVPLLGTGGSSQSIKDTMLGFNYNTYSHIFIILNLMKCRKIVKLMHYNRKCRY